MPCLKGLAGGFPLYRFETEVCRPGMWERASEALVKLRPSFESNLLRLPPLHPLHELLETPVLLFHYVDIEQVRDDVFDAHFSGEFPTTFTWTHHNAEQPGPEYRFYVHRPKILHRYLTKRFAEGTPCGNGRHPESATLVCAGETQAASAGMYYRTAQQNRLAESH